MASETTATNTKIEGIVSRCFLLDEGLLWMPFSGLSKPPERGMMAAIGVTALRDRHAHENQRGKNRAFLRRSRWQAHLLFRHYERRVSPFKLGLECEERVERNWVLLVRERPLSLSDYE